MSDPSIVDFLDSQGLRSDFASRQHIAQYYGIPDYTGTAEQNTRLLGILQEQDTRLLGILQESAMGRFWEAIKGHLKRS